VVGASFMLGAIVCFTIHRLDTVRVRERPWLRERRQPAAK
jgi:hypothetical protein